MIDVMRDMWREIAIAVAVAATITAVLVLLWLRWSASSAPQKHYALAKLRLRRLPAKSPTRLRIEAAQRAFTKGWKVRHACDMRAFPSPWQHAASPASALTAISSAIATHTAGMPCTGAGRLGPVHVPDVVRPRRGD